MYEQPNIKYIKIVFYQLMANSVLLNVPLDRYLKHFFPTISQNLFTLFLFFLCTSFIILQSFLYFRPYIINSLFFMPNFIDISSFSIKISFSMTRIFATSLHSQLLIPTYRSDRAFEIKERIKIIPSTCTVFEKKFENKIILYGLDIFVLILTHFALIVVHFFSSSPTHFCNRFNSHQPLIQYFHLDHFLFYIPT